MTWAMPPRRCSAGLRRRPISGSTAPPARGRRKRSSTTIGPRCLPYPVRFEPVIWKQALVHRDSHIEFGRRLYSVPWRFIGKSVWLRVTPDTVAVYCDNIRIATHARRIKGPRSTLPGHLPEYRAELGQRAGHLPLRSPFERAP